MDRLFPKSLEERWKDPKGLIQVFTGPRQVGKTTAATQRMDAEKSVYASADLPTPPTPDFIEDHWKKARAMASNERTLILDEIQKIPRWSEVVKKLWDEDQRNQIKMRVCLLGSSAILIEKGLSESLTGRFEVNYFPHWTYSECHKTFHITPEEYSQVGGYPKAYDFLDDPQRGREYLQNSILEPTLGRDILALHSVDKPALLRQLFWYTSKLPAQIVSFEKILGHLQGRGHSATLVHYADLLSMAYLLKSLSKFSPTAHRVKKSIPKWILPNPGLVDGSIKEQGFKGFLFENMVGSHLLNITFGDKKYELMYWREENREIDFILTRLQEPLIALEIKSGRLKNIPKATDLKRRNIDCPLLVVSPNNVEKLLLTTEVNEVVKLA